MMMILSWFVLFYAVWCFVVVRLIMAITQLAP